jgi:hypothetical protein
MTSFATNAFCPFLPPHTPVLCPSRSLSLAALVLSVRAAPKSSFVMMLSSLTGAGGPDPGGTSAAPDDHTRHLEPVSCTAAPAAQPSPAVSSPAQVSPAKGRVSFQDASSGHQEEASSSSSAAAGGTLEASTPSQGGVFAVDEASASLSCRFMTRPMHRLRQVLLCTYMVYCSPAHIWFIAPLHIHGLLLPCTYMVYCSPAHTWFIAPLNDCVTRQRLSGKGASRRGAFNH